MEIGELDHVIVDDRQPPDAGAGERRDHRAADAARADHRDARRLELLLPDPADLRQHDLPRIAFELGGRRGSLARRAEAPGPALVSLELRDLDEIGLEHRRRNQLGDALAAADLERLGCRGWRGSPSPRRDNHGRSCRAC